ncbi:MAG TPA: di-trans,poly-cis-decaprenylcistransferase [Chromatiaceae bacterium]|nr:di-trans,poly-cis-decaprenylcistransferase [Chromatiaceae bacterium]
MDGNGRWAQARGKPRHAGHRAGVETVRRVIEYCGKQGVRVLTLFAFSSENWQRPKSEVKMLMELFFTALNREIERMRRRNVRLRIVGDISAFSDKLQKTIGEAERLTAENDGLLLQIAANYGGRWDITEATRRIARQVSAGLLRPEQIDEELVAGNLSFADVPDPDLFIRTGGEKRISNFMLWQCAYTELYFTDVLWPDFDESVLGEAFQDFARRQRRFGRVAEQVAG